MRRYDRVIWAGAVVVSALLHGLLFFNTGSVAGNSKPVKSERTVTRVSFRSVTAPQTPQVAAEAAREVEVIEAREQEPQPKPKPLKKAPRAKTLRQPETKPAQPERQEQMPSAVSTVEAENSPAATEVVSGTVEDPALIEKAKQEYLRRLMTHIEACKEYPRAARRRRIEGDVRVSFSLQAEGGVAALQAEGGHRLLAGAARQAVECATPMPPPPENLVLPWQVSFTMRFSLD